MFISCRLLCLLVIPILLCGCGRSAQHARAQQSSDQQPSGQGDDKDKDAKRPGIDTIPNLIAQLRDSKIEKREQASKALAAIGIPALEALRKAAKDSDPEVAEQAAQLVKSIEKSFDQLLADYGQYDLPLPPESAKLVRFESGGRAVVNDKLMPPTHFLGFQLEAATKSNPALLLVGTHKMRLDRHTPVEIVEPKAELVKSIDVDWRDRSTFGLNVGLAIALQCKARGWNELAEELWTASALPNW